MSNVEDEDEKRSGAPENADIAAMRALEAASKARREAKAKVKAEDRERKLAAAQIRKRRGPRPLG